MADKTNKVLFALWAGLFIICAGLGFIPEPEGALRFFLTALAMLFFLPPAVLLYRARANADKALCRLLHLLAALSLSATLVVLILNLLSALRSEFLGRLLHYILIIVSSPMICGGNWAMSLFFWACLLVVSRKATCSVGKK